MNRRTLAAWTALAFFLLASVPVLATGDRDWEFIDKEDGVHTWRKDLDGDRAAFRGQTFIRGTIDDVLKPILDWKRHTEWMYAVTESTLLKELSPTRVLMYTRVKGMWPVWDRDVIVESAFQWGPDRKYLAIYGNSIQSDLKKVPRRVVRMPFLKGAMKMWQVEPQKVKVLYDIEADLGGRVPKWLSRLAAREIPYHTLFDLRKRVEAKK